MAQENIRQDVNGSTDKPYPQERNFVMNADPEMGVKSRTEVPSVEAGHPLGQAKYAVRGMGPSINLDRTRNTADDDKACKVADTGRPAVDNFYDGGK